MSFFFGSKRCLRKKTIDRQALRGYHRSEAPPFSVPPWFKPCRFSPAGLFLLNIDGGKLCSVQNAKAACVVRGQQVVWGSRTDAMIAERNGGTMRLKIDSSQL